VILNNAGVMPHSPLERRKIEDWDRTIAVQYAIPADSFARAVVFAISQPENVDINEILFRPTRQEL
jgi:NADP-dependent 3-hydroxy acid dehydrogenase YdfG